MTTINLQNMFELKVLIQNVAPKLTARIESGVKQLLALITSDGDVLLYYTYGELRPVIKRLSWFSDGNKSVQALCFDPTATWLLVVCVDGSLYIIPALSLVDKKQKIDCKWSITDATHFPKSPQSPDSKATSIVWWQTSDSNQNALIGYESSKIALISLTDGRCISTCCITEAVSHLHLCQDYSLDSVSLLINGESGYQWRLVLEQHSTGYVWPSDANTNNDEASHSRLYSLKQMGVDKLTSLKQRISDARGSRRDSHSSDSTSESLCSESSKSGPELLPHLSNTYFAPQYARNRYLFSAFYKPNSLLTIHAVDVESAPLFVYKLPQATNTVLLTDRFIYTVNDDQNVISVISCQLAECLLEGDSAFNRNSLITNFTLKDENEIVLDIYKLTDKVVVKERGSNVSKKDVDKSILPKSIDDLNIDKIKIDTCIIVTTKGVYKILVRASPINLFINAVVDNYQMDVAERILAVVFALNVQKLLETSGDFLISNGNYHQGLLLYKQANIHLLKRVLKLAVSADCRALLKFVNLCLSGSKVDMSIATKIHIGNLAVMAYTELILRFSGQKRVINTREFMDFLCHEEYYDQVLAVNVACQAGHWNVLSLLAKTRGLQLEVVSTLSQILQTSRAPRPNDNEFLMALSEPTLTQSLLIYPDGGQIILQYIRSNLAAFSVDILRRFALQLDPSQPAALSVINCLMQKRTNSSSLDSTLDSGDYDVSQISTIGKEFIETFILVLIELVRLTGDNMYNASLLERIDPPELFKINLPLLNKYPNFHPLSCGHEHAAVVRNGNVYTMGIANSGCLGLGPLLTPSSSPKLVQTLRDLKLQVFSVSCGRKHTIALTDYGIYVWGSNAFGQLGLGPLVRESPYPQPLNILCGHKIVDVIAGQYHSVALTYQGLVYTWGWGIHGQLGHGTCDNEYFPRLVVFRCATMQIAAGHAHTLLLSTEGKLYGFGSNVFGQLEMCHMEQTKTSVPIWIMTMPEIFMPVEKIATGYFHNIAVFVNQEVYTWGANPQEVRLSQSKLGRKIYMDGKLPPWKSSVHVYTAETKNPVEHITIGYGHCALLHNGKILWGKSRDGELNTPITQEPEKCNFFNQKCVQIACGLDYIMALEQSGKLLAWGHSGMAQTLLGKSLEEEHRNSDGKLLMFKNTKRLIKLPHQPKMLLETYSIEVPGLPSMDIVYEPPSHSSLFLKNCVPNAVRLVENNPPFESGRHTPPIKSSTTFDFLNDSFVFTYGQKTLHYVLETYYGFYDTDSVISKCIDANNFQAVSKISTLDGHFGDSLSFQLKAFKNYLDKYTLEYSFKSVSKPAYVNAKHNDMNKHIELQAMKLNDANYDKNNGSPVQMLSTSSSLDSIRQWGDDLEHQGGYESPCELSDIGDIRQSMAQYLQSIKDMTPITSVSKIISTEENPPNKPSPEQDSTGNQEIDMELHIADVKTKELVNSASQIVEFYIKKTYAFENLILMQNILMKSIDFWLTNNLPVFALEKILLKNMDKYFYPLSILLFCKNFNNSSEEYEKSDELKSAGFLKQFSTKFCLQLCSMVLENVSKQ